MSDAGQTGWAKHAAAEGAAVSADPGESGDVIDTGGGDSGADATPPPAMPDGAEPQPEMAPAELGDQPEMPGAGMTALG